MIKEPDVALTDFALAAETAILAWLLYRLKAPLSSLKTSFIGFFLFIGAAAISGAVFHGFLNDQSTLSGSLWLNVMVFIGLAGYAAWRIGALLLFSSRVAEWIDRLAFAAFVIYSLVVVFYSQSFVLAIVYYLPAVVLMTIGFAVQLKRRRDRAALLGTVGMLLTFVAAGVQHFGIALHPHYFNHNALYHLGQGIALLLIFFAARRFIADEVGLERRYRAEA